MATPKVLPHIDFPLRVPGSKKNSPVIPKHLLFLSVIFIALGLRSTAAAQDQGIVTLVSVNNRGEPGNQNSFKSRISFDGRFVLFSSDANNLIPDHWHNNGGIFLIDRANGDIAWISDKPDNTSVNMNDFQLDISGDGRFLFYETQSRAIEERHNPGNPLEAYVFDQLTGLESRLFVPESNSPPNLRVISSAYDGRYLAFSGFGLQQGNNDINSKGGAFIWDRLTQRVIHPDYFNHPENPEGFDLTWNPQISGDGRFLVVFSGSTQSSPGDTEEPVELILFNRVLDTFRKFPTSLTSASIPDQKDPPQITNNGSTLAYLSGAQDPTSDDGAIILIDTQSGTSRPLETQFIPTSFRLSSNGEQIAYTAQSNSHHTTLYIQDLHTGIAIVVAENIIALDDISTDGSTLVFRKEVNGISQVMVWDKTGSTPTSHVLAGRVVDATSHPLALVTIEDSQGNKNRTDGNGFFWLGGVKPGTVILHPSKEGIKFDPEKKRLDVNFDSIALNFIYAHEDSLKEAIEDIGMPYSFERGVNGPFHGYSAGYCTDLILDAYTWGVDFNIQFALEQDFRAHPWHFYRWRDARNAHDMWRYFTFSNQLQPHPNPYQPGDIVFFDWSEDGEIDHVAIVSEVNSNYRPRKLIDATGVINSNPSGLASELPWENFHENTVRGFARWSGKYEPVIPKMPDDQVIQMALSGTGLVFWLVDTHGNIISSFQNAIPGARFDDWTWEKTISILNPVEQVTQYMVLLYNPGNNPRPYQLTSQFVQEGLVTGRFESKGFLKAGDFGRFQLVLDKNLDAPNRILPRDPTRRMKATPGFSVY